MLPKIKNKIQNIACDIINGGIMNGDIVDAAQFAHLKRLSGLLYT